MATKGYSTFFKAPALLEPHHQIVKCHIQITRWEGFLLLCRSAVGVFYSYRVATNNYTYTYTYRNIFNTIRTSGHSSLEKYTSHFIERVVCERWVGDWTELQHIDLHSSGHSRISFPFSYAAQSGAWEPNLCWDMVLIPASSSPTDVNFLSPGLYSNLTSTYFLRASQFALSSTLDSQARPLISSTACTCYLHRCISHLTICNTYFSFDNMQHSLIWQYATHFSFDSMQHSPSLLDIIRRWTNTTQTKTLFRWVRIPRRVLESLRILTVTQTPVKTII